MTRESKEMLWQFPISFTGMYLDFEVLQTKVVHFCAHIIYIYIYLAHFEVILGQLWDTQEAGALGHTVGHSMKHPMGCRRWGQKQVGFKGRLPSLPGTALRKSRKGRKGPFSSEVLETPVCSQNSCSQFLRPLTPPTQPAELRDFLLIFY